MVQLKLALPVPDDVVLKFVASITLRNGRKIYAKHYGKRAFPIFVKAKH